MNEWVDDSCAISLGLFLLFACLLQLQCNTLCFILLYILLLSLFSLKRNGKGMDLDERGNAEELGEIEGGETKIRIYHVTRESTESSSNRTKKQTKHKAQMSKSTSMWCWLDILDKVKSSLILISNKVSFGFTRDHPVFPNLFYFL